MAWVYLVFAGLLEIVWAVGLKYTEGFTKLVPSLITITAMALSFIALAPALKTIPMGTAYAVWVGIGAFGVALIGILFYGESHDFWRIVCLMMIIGGVIGLKLVSPT